MPAQSLPSSITRASTVYDCVRREIVRGILLPGARLRIDALGARFDVGSSPVREALNRLAAEGLAVLQDQRGFHVAPVGMDQLHELTRSRCLLNEVLLRESIARGDAQWEEAIVTAFYRLSKHRPSGIEVAEETALLREQLHRGFHLALVSACGSPSLLDFAETLFDRADRYRYLFRIVSPDRDSNTEHRDIMQATLDRDTPRAVKLLNDHALRTAEAIARFGADALGATPSMTVVG